jgi:hypothetical protein
VTTSSKHVYEVRPRKDKRGVDLISNALPFGGLWYGEPDAISNAVGSVKFYSQFTFAWQRAFVISAWDQALFGLTPRIADLHGVDRARGQL